MNSADSFSGDYAEARRKFRTAAAEAGGVLESLQHPESGPDGDALFTDVARFGPAKAERMLVLISGTHGVEGFCGSGAQVDLLRRDEAKRLPAGTGVLMIHAINPHGFAWLRRVTHENVDLNRNWIDFDSPLPANPGYDELSVACCPEKWTEEARAEADALLAAYSARLGATALQHAVSGGQYAHPGGIYFGGVAPSWSRQALAHIFEEHLREVSAVAIIDYHTGLGPWGYGEQIVMPGRGTPAFRRAAQWYGSAVRSVADGTSASTPIAGDGLSAAPGLLPHARVTAMALEVGTIDQAQTHFALRADAWLHAHGDPGSPEGNAIKSLMRAAFYGDADDWKGMVAGQSLLACRQALAGLASAPQP
jgi:hypothetical protein